MPIVYRVQHATRYMTLRYRGVRAKLRLTPRMLPWQSVLDTTITTTPVSAWSDTRTDYFGNQVTPSGFTSVTTGLRPSRRASLASNLDSTGSSDTMAWGRRATSLRLTRPPRRCRRSEFVFDSPFVAAAPELAAYARPSFSKGRPRSSRRSTNSRTASSRVPPTNRRPRQLTHRCSTRCA